MFHYNKSELKLGLASCGPPLLHYQGETQRGDDDQEQQRAQSESFHGGSPKGLWVRAHSSPKLTTVRGGNKRDWTKPLRGRNQAAPPI
jgi:hypothetical protein